MSSIKSDQSDFWNNSFCSLTKKWQFHNNMLKLFLLCSAPWSYQELLTTSMTSKLIWHLLKLTELYYYLPQMVSTGVNFQTIEGIYLLLWLNCLWTNILKQSTTKSKQKVLVPLEIKPLLFCQTKLAQLLINLNQVTPRLCRIEAVFLCWNCGSKSEGRLCDNSNKWLFPSRHLL